MAVVAYYNFCLLRRARVLTRGRPAPESRPGTPRQPAIRGGLKRNVASSALTAGPVASKATSYREMCRGPRSDRTRLVWV